MRTITQIDTRHTLVDFRQAHYLSFPDVCRAPSGRLLAAYREADQHVASRAKLLATTSDDNGRTWAAPQVLNPMKGHCPRLTVLSDGEIVLLDDASKALYWTLDEGRTWSAPQPAEGIAHGILDRILELGSERFLTAGQSGRGKAARAVMGQGMHEVMAYRSENRGASWEPRSVISVDPALSLCEVSMVRLQDARILCALRENSGVHEPSYYCLSEDEGETWTEPAPMPLIGHRPSMGLTRSGKLLVTYRNVAPESGTCAWLGTLDDLGEFAVHGMSSPQNPKLNSDCLIIENDDKARDTVLYALRPFSDPRFATGRLEADVRVDRAAANACRIHFGIDWQLLPDGVVPGIAQAARIPFEANVFHHLRFDFDRGRLHLQIDGKDRFSTDVEAGNPAARKIQFGHRATRGNQIAGRSVWRRFTLEINEPRYDRRYEWRWTPENGLPDAAARERELELKNARGLSFGDMGYSGWAELDDGEFVALYHHADPSPTRYRSMHGSFIMATRFSEADFVVRPISHDSTNNGATP